jgi:lipopolysaccharide/colanic/teichoic acid biosynthesis glycosyltransferase
MKRAFDLVVALLGLVATSPIILAAAVAVKLESSGPAFYSGPRVGRNGEPFRIHKLRTMRARADGLGPAVTAADDVRVTGVGRLLRRTKADELPQLFNVLKGEMSLVGPRPEHPDYVKRYTPEQRLGLSVRPGMTGPSAIAFIDEEEILRGGDPETTYVKVVMPQKLALDLDYVRTATFAGDLRILLATARLVVRRAFGSRKKSPRS